MSGAILLLPLYAFMAWTGTLPFYPAYRGAALSVLGRCHHISSLKITFRNDLQSKAGLRVQAYCGLVDG